MAKHCSTCKMMVKDMAKHEKTPNHKRRAAGGKPPQKRR